MKLEYFRWITVYAIKRVVPDVSQRDVHFKLNFKGVQITLKRAQKLV